MGFIPVLDGDGNHLQDAGGNDIWVWYDGPAAERTIAVQSEDRTIVIRDESRIVGVTSGS